MPVLTEPPQKMCGDNLFGLVSQCFEPAAARQRFQSSVPADDPPFHIFDNDSYTDGFDNIFAEILQTLIFRGLLLVLAVEPRVSEPDADIIRNGLETRQM